MRKLIRAKLYSIHDARKLIRAKISTNKVYLSSGRGPTDTSIENYRVKSATNQRVYSSLSNKRPWTFIVFREDFQGGRSYYMVDAY